MSLDIEHLKTWTGKQETLEDRVTPVPVAALSATLDRDDPRPRPGDALPPLWHWLFFLPLARHSELGPDGHPRRGPCPPLIRRGHGARRRPGRALVIRRLSTNPIFRKGNRRGHSGAMPCRHS